MKKTLTIFLFLILYSFIGFSEKIDIVKLTDALTREEMQSVIEFLSDDLLEGRAPGQRGGNLSEIYIRSLFKLIGLKPGVKGKYLQPFNLKGFTQKKLELDFDGIKVKYINELAGCYIGDQKKFDISADTVFIGFGIHADFWNWDDFKKISIKDKIVIARVNDPGLYNEKIFEGKTLTYYGRWRYKIEEVAKRGALGIILIHSDESAGYGWEVVKNSRSGEKIFLNSDTKRNLKFCGWIKENKLREVLKTKKIDFDKLYKKSLKRSFKPKFLGFKTRIKGENSSRLIKNNNVVGRIDGKIKKSIVFSAHIDHLGKDPGLKGDNIYNGAIDNGSAVASMIMVAKLLKKMEKDLYYSIVFLACNAEEAGLLGSRFYVNKIKNSSVVCNINFESTPVWNKSDTLMGIGARFSTFENLLKQTAKKMGLGYSEFSMYNQGFYYRSDQFSFANYNIPSIWISAGEREVSGEKNYVDFWRTRYHTVKDEFNPKWKLDGMKQTIKAAVLIVDLINRNKTIPKWKKYLSFPVLQ